MAFYTNTAAGSVVHCTNEFNTKLIVPNDIALTSDDDTAALASTDYRSILKLELGKFERAIFRIWLDVVNEADGDLKYKVIVPANTVSYRARRVKSEQPISNPVTETIDFDSNTSGLAEQTPAGGDGDLYALITGTITCGNTAGALDLQACQATSHASPTTIKFGTYLEYMKF